VVVAVAAVAVALVVGLRGLFADPIKGTAPDGTTIIQGTFEPWASGGDPVQGYIQAGSRSVFVILPRGCPAPPANSDVAVHGRLDTTQGKGTYRAVGCAS